jgi:hypothetical protein
VHGSLPRPEAHVPSAALRRQAGTVAGTAACVQSRRQAGTVAGTAACVQSRRQAGTVAGTAACVQSRRQAGTVAGTATCVQSRRQAGAIPHTVALLNTLRSTCCRSCLGAGPLPVGISITLPDFTPSSQSHIGRQRQPDRHSDNHRFPQTCRLHMKTPFRACAHVSCTSDHRMLYLVYTASAEIVTCMRPE